MTSSPDHSGYRFSVRVRSDDLAVINCLRALSQYSQKTGNNRIPWGGTKDADWKRANHHVTFRFTTPEYRDGFLSVAERLLPKSLWSMVRKVDDDPASPQR